MGAGARGGRGDAGQGSGRRAAAVATAAVAALALSAAPAAAIGGPDAAHVSDTRVGDSAIVTVTFSTARSTASDPGEPVSSVTLEGSPAFVIAEDRCQPKPVTASCTVVVRFSPTAPGTATSTLVVAGADRTARTQLDGLGYSLGPRLVLSAGHLDFGYVEPFKLSGAQRVAVTNSGDRSAAIVAARIAGADPGEFLLSGDGCSRTTLVPGATCSLDARYAPTRDRGAQAQLTLDGESGPLATVTLAGTGVAGSVPAEIPVGASSDPFVNGGCSLSIQKLRASRHVIRAQLYLTCPVHLSVGVWRRGKRERRSTPEVSAGTHVIALHGTFAPGAHLVRIHARVGRQDLGDGATVTVRR